MGDRPQKRAASARFTSRWLSIGSSRVVVEDWLTLLHTTTRFPKCSRPRVKIVEGVASGRIDAIIGTSVLDEGLDIPNLSAIHLTCPTSNGNKLKQQVGRCRRPSPLPCVVRDYVDAKCGAVTGSYSIRRRIYREADWTISGNKRGKHGMVQFPEWTADRQPVVGS